MSKQKFKPKKHYYRVMSYHDGSGQKYGWVIKCYTDEQAMKCGMILKRLDYHFTSD